MDFCIYACRLYVAGAGFSRLLGVKKLTVHELTEKLSATPALVLIDVRTEQEFVAGHAAAAKLIPLSELRQRLDEVKKMCPDGGGCCCLSKW